MKFKAFAWIVPVCLLVPAIVSGAGLEVTFENDLLTVRCVETPLARVFEQIKSATGMELILEDEVKTKRLTAEIVSQPAHSAIERLLEGAGVNYAMSFDVQNWQRVSMVFIGTGGAPVASSKPAAQPRATSRRRPVRRSSPAEDPDQDYVEDLDDFEDEELPGEMQNDMIEGQPDQPIGPGPGTPPPSYPRSRFTPGLESSPFGQTTPQVPPATEPTPNQPPAYYPFLDPFGRPIPVPQQQQEQQKKNPQKEKQ
jgi:hypothetical protein